MKLATLPAQASTLGCELRSILHLEYTLLLMFGLRPTFPNVKLVMFTFIVRKFQNFHDYCRPDRKQFKNHEKLYNLFIISNCNTAEPSSEPSFEVCEQVS